MRHLQELTYEVKPDYNLIRKVLSSVIKREGINETDSYDWETSDKEFMDETLETSQKLSKMII